MQIAQLVTATHAEGPGLRWAIWFQGCPLRCPGCCNPEMLSFQGGEPTTLAALRDSMQAARDTRRNAGSQLVDGNPTATEPVSFEGAGIEGITMLGGEPFAHAGDALALATVARELELSVMIFSGFTIEELRAQRSSDVDRLLELTDILVDGPYLRDQPDTTRRWIGSTNQRIHFLTERYRADDPCWQSRNTLELRLDADGLQVNGFPSPQNKTFWRR